LPKVRSSPSGEPVGDTDAQNEKAGAANRSISCSPRFGKKKSLSRFLFARSKLFQKKGNCDVEVSNLNQTDDTVVYDDILNSSPDRQRNRGNAETEDIGSSGNPQVSDTGSSGNAQVLDGSGSSGVAQVSDNGAGEDRQILNVNNEKPREPANTGNEIRPFQTTLDADNTASSKKKVSPPLMEIMKCQRRNSGSSDVSSLSGAGARGRDVPLEYFLALDMRQKQSNNMFMDDILNIAGQPDTLQLQKSESTENTAWEPLPSCLILLTDPMQRIFEMVSVLYAPKKDTVANILARCTKSATDDRLKKQTYVGLAYGGDHCSLEEMIPKNAIRRSLEEGKPILAIPAKYSAHQIELVGRSLLASPSVQRLLDKQLESIGQSPPKRKDSKTNESELPVTQIVVPPRRSSRKVISA